MARIWFTKENSQIDDPTDTSLRILNRAVRHLVDGHGMEPTASLLAQVRMTYREGMSAKDLIDKIEQEIVQ